MSSELKSGNALADAHAHAIKGKVILVTGVTLGGLGGGFVLAVARAQPSLLILAGRSVTKLQQTAQAVSEQSPRVNVRTLELDLISLAAARKAAEAVNAWSDVPQIDILVNNAGVMATEWASSPDGHESQLAINHLGHFLFTNLIMRKILKSPAPRVVIVSSNGHRLSPVRFDDPNFKNGQIYNKWTAYGQSKTANMLMAISLAEKLGKKSNLSAFSVQPGLVISNLGSHLKLFGDDTSDLDAMKEIDSFFGCHLAWIDYTTYFTVQTPEQAASNLVYTAFDPAITPNGSYLEDCRVASPWTDVLLPWATSPVEAERCWKLSEKLVGQEFSY
ncbi:NAD(P)-binding protein [Hypoxylon cercidicola]|nr:NAD(P)-binding protein [Hypoxylon cercidicola]